MIPGAADQPADAEPAAPKVPIAAISTPLSLVVSNVSQTGCSPACLHEKRIIRRELQKWGKNVVYLVGELPPLSSASCLSRAPRNQSPAGFESVAQEFVGPKRWKRITSGLPCPPSSSGTGERLGSAQDPEPQRAVICDDAVPVRLSSAREEPEPVDWEPLKDDCFNCALRKSKLSLLNPEVPDSTDVASAKAPDSSPVMKQSNERMCSCDPHESCPSCSPLSPASSQEDPLPADDVIRSSSRLLDQLSSHKLRHPDQSNSSQKTVRQTKPNFHLLQQLKKQIIFPSSNSATSSSCDQPLDLSFNSTRAQQLPVATSSSSSAKGPLDQNSLLEVVSGSSETAVAPAPVQKRARETTWKRNYTEEELNQALQDILGGKLGTRRAAVIYGIPRSTLRNKVYKLGKGSPVGPGRLPGRRPKSAAAAAASLSLSATSKVLQDGKVPVPDSGPVSSEPAIIGKKEPQVIPKTRVGRKTGKNRSREESDEVVPAGATSESLKQMLRENIFSKNNVSSTDRNNNTGSIMSREAAPSLLLNSPAFMSILPLMMMNHNQFNNAPDQSMSEAAANYAQTSNLFNQPASAAGTADQMIAQSNHHQAMSMLSTLDPAAISAIAPLICSYLFNFERLVLASTAASAASASLSATASTLSASGSKSTPSVTGLPDYGYPSTDPFFLDYIQRLRVAAPEPVSELLTQASATNKCLRQESSDGPDDGSAEMEDEEGRAGESENQESGSESARLIIPNGSFSECDDGIDTHNKKVDPVILKIPSLKSKKSGTRSSDQGIRCPDKGLEGSESRSLLERNLLSLSSNRSNSYASSVNSEESGCEQSVTSGGKKGSRSSGKRANGCKPSKSVDSTGSCDGSGIKNRPKRGRYRNYDREALDKAVAAVQSGEMSVHRAGTFYGVPHSTLEYKVKQRHLLREKKRPATSTSTATAASSNNSSASSPPDATHPLQDPDPDEPDEKRVCRDSSFESLIVNDL